VVFTMDTLFGEIHYTGLNASDLDRSLNFYRNVLGPGQLFELQDTLNRSTAFAAPLPQVRSATRRTISRPALRIMGMAAYIGRAPYGSRRRYLARTRPGEEA